MAAQNLELTRGTWELLQGTSIYQHMRDISISIIVDVGMKA